MVERVNAFSQRTVIIRRYALTLAIAGGLLLLLCALLTWPGAPDVARAQEARTVDQAAITVKQTVGEAPGICAATTAIAVQTGRTVYYCITLRNSGTVSLTRHILAAGNITTTFLYPLNPGAEINLTNNILTEII